MRSPLKEAPSPVEVLPSVGCFSMRRRSTTYLFVWMDIDVSSPGSREFTGAEGAVSRVEGRSRCLFPASGFQHVEERSDQVHGQREDDGGVLVGCNYGQRFQVAQLDRLGLLPEHLRRLRKLLGGLKLAFRVNHLGAALALGLGL